MYASTSFASHLIHDLLREDFHSRRLLLQNPLNQSPNSSIISHNSTSLSLGGRNFDANVVMVVTVLLCALICSLGLNSIIRCVLRCSNIVINSTDSSSSTSSTSSRLANTGIKKKALKTFPIVSYSGELNNLPGLDPECVICLSEFSSDDKVRILPICNHGFHVCCIDKWLSSHSSCPKCRQCLMKTCHKIVGKQAHVVPVPQTIIRIEPLQPEGLVRNYREVS